jgi:hypothetical protein
MVAGSLVMVIFCPSFQEGTINLATSFPRVCQINTGTTWMSDVQHDQFEAVLRSYAQLGTLVSVVDRRLPLVFGLRKIDLCNSLFIDGRQRANLGRATLVNAALPTFAWPVLRDHTHLHARLHGYDTSKEIGAALVRAQSVEFLDFRSKADESALFGAKEVIFNLTWIGCTDGRRSLISLVHIEELLQPSKWVDGKLPSVIIHCSSIPNDVSKCIEEIKKIAALVPLGGMTAYARNDQLYASCGIPVLSVTLRRP